MPISRSGPALAHRKNLLVAPTCTCLCAVSASTLDLKLSKPKTNLSASRKKFCLPIAQLSMMTRAATRMDPLTTRTRWLVSVWSIWTCLDKDIDTKLDCCVDKSRERTQVLLPRRRLESLLLSNWLTMLHSWLPIKLRMSKSPRELLSRQNNSMATSNPTPR